MNAYVLRRLDPAGTWIYVESVKSKYNLTDNAARHEHALKLVAAAQSRSVEGGGTWQTWDWLLTHLLKQQSASTEDSSA